MRFIKHVAKSSAQARESTADTRLHRAQRLAQLRRKLNVRVPIEEASFNQRSLVIVER
jgi:hypothetical protein